MHSFMRGQKGPLLSSVEGIKSEKNQQIYESKEMRIGYARVSTVEQNLELQLDALKAAGCERIFKDLGVSGAAAEREGLSKAMAALSAGDVLVVWRLDRLGRSLIRLIELINLVAAKEAHFMSLNEAIDTDSPGGRLVFHMMGALAEFERSLISERTRAGMQVAKKAGKQIGRPPSLSPAQVSAADAMLASGQATVEQLADDFGVHVRTLKRALSGKKENCPD